MLISIIIGAVLYIIIFCILQCISIEVEIDKDINYENEKLYKIKFLRCLFPHNRRFKEEIAKKTFLLQLVTLICSFLGVVAVILLGLYFGENIMGFFVIGIFIINILWAFAISAIAKKS